MKRIAIALAVIVSSITSGRADLVVDPGIVLVPVGATTVQIPIQVSGGNVVTDFAGVASVENSPAAEPAITAVSYAGSIWTSAPGGYLDFFTDDPPATVVGPNIVLLETGETVTGNGVLLTLTVNVTGLAVGDYPVTLAGSEFANAGNPVNASFPSGIIRIVGGIQAWRINEFGEDAADSELEDTVWGNGANPDGDPLSNIEEYYYGTDPNDPNTGAPSASQAGGLTIFITNSAGSDYATVSYTRRKSAGAGFVGTLERSPDLESWFTAGFADVAAPVDLPGGVFEFVVRRYNTPISPTNLWHFFRLVLDSGE